MSRSFAQLGLPDDVVRALARAGFTTPFPIQSAAIPDALAGRDVCGRAPTGSGKTLAFGLAALALIERAQRGRPEALILAPTRELAEQIKKDLMPFAKAHGRFVGAVYGGVSDRPQKNELRRGVDVLVATPGRLQDLVDQGAVSLAGVEVVVVDEADRMADMGFLPDVRRLLDLTPSTRQTMLFSATLDGDVATLIDQYQREPVHHEAPAMETEAVDATHLFWLVRHEERISWTAEVIKNGGRTIVFTRTRHGADRLARQLAKLHVEAAVLHGGKSQAQRSRALRAFSSGKVEALIATDVAARGIHVEAVAHVVQYDPPADHKDYLHRAGRTGRAGASGTVVTMVQPQQRRAVRRMQAELSSEWPIESPSLDELMAPPAAAQSTQNHRARNHRSKDRGAQDHGSRDRRPGTEQSRERDGRRPNQRNGRKPTERNGHEPNERNGRKPNERNGRKQAGHKQAGPQPAAASGESVYVANIPWHLDHDGLAKMFAQHGHVYASHVIVDKRSGRSKGYGFVDMPKPDAEAAIRAMNGRRIEGRAIAVRLAKPRTYGG